MIQDMKKLTFLITNGEYDKFIGSIRELGVIHVQQLQQGASSDELQSALALAQRFKSAIATLDYAKDSYTTQQTYSQFPADASLGNQCLSDIERLVERENDLKHQLDSVDKDIQRMEVWGDIDWEKIDQLAATGTNMYFFSAPAKLYKAEWGDKYFATPIAEQNKKIYFLAFSSDVPDITAERIELPRSSYSTLLKQSDDLKRQIDEIHESLLAINIQYRNSLLAAQARPETAVEENEDDGPVGTEMRPAVRVGLDGRRLGEGFLQVPDIADVEE